MNPALGGDGRACRYVNGGENKIFLDVNQQE